MSYIKDIKKERPQFLLLLSFVEMWERFSYYGMRALLVLYLTSELGFSDNRAYATYALFATIGYFGCVVFGYIADTVSGPRTTFVIGGIIMTIGHAVMTLSCFSQEAVYLGLALIAVGTSAFKGNITNILGLCYQKHNMLDKQENGYVFFYSAVNLGGFLASVVCGTIGMKYSWHYGFGLAGVGMFLGLLTFFRFEYILGDIGNIEKPARNNKSSKLVHPKALAGIIILIASILSTIAMKSPEEYINYFSYAGILVLIYSLYVLYKSSANERGNLICLFVLMFFFCMFYALEMQIGGFIKLFSSRNVDLNVLGYEISPAAIEAINPFTIIVFGVIMSYAFHLSQNKATIYRFALGLFSIPLCFILFMLGGKFAHEGVVSIWYFVFGMVAMAVGELLVGPFIQSIASILAPENKRGFIFGLMMFVISYANIIGNFAAQYMSVKDDGLEIKNKIQSLAVYQNGFETIVKFTLIVTIVFIAISPVISRKISNAAKNKK